jgi:ABC-type multidrug transport system fused ATPase/permease subunit
MTYRQALKSALALLTKKERKNLLISMVAQVLIGTLDIIGVASISITSLLVVRGNGSSNQLMKYLPDFLKSEPEKLAGMFALIAVISMLLKSLGSFLTTRFLLYRLAKIQKRITLELFNECLSMRPGEFMKESQKSLPTIIADGSASLTLGLIGFSMIAFTETVVLTLLLIPLLVIAPILTLLTILVFAASFLILHKILSKWSTRSGLESAKSLSEIRNLVMSVGKLSKVIQVSGKTKSFEDQLDKLATTTSKSGSDTYFVQQVPKYILELTVILIGVVTAIYLSTTSSFGKSVGILTLLVATSFRLLPSLLRIQGAVLISRTSLGLSTEVINLNTHLTQSILSHRNINKPLLRSKATKPPGIEIKNLNFEYPGTNTPILTDFNLVIAPGTFTVIKGKSGAGKSTLVDLMLGILEPDSGRIEIVGSDYGNIKASYMPQETTIIDGSLIENIALGIPLDEIDLMRISEVIRAAGIDSIIGQTTNQDFGKIGFEGRLLSGGQYQRVGLARALYEDPGLIILDEPTSALDLASEEKILETLNKLKGQITVILIAHSDKPEKYADNVVSL